MTVLCAGKPRLRVPISGKKTLMSLESAQPPIQSVTRALSLGLKRPALEADYSPPSTLSLTKSEAILPLPHTRA